MGNVGRIGEGEVTLAFVVLLRTAARGAAPSSGRLRSEGNAGRARAGVRRRIRVLLAFLRIIKKVINQHTTEPDLKVHKSLEFLCTEGAARAGGGARLGTGRGGPEALRADQPPRPQGAVRERWRPCSGARSLEGETRVKSAVEGSS